MPRSGDANPEFLARPQSVAGSSDRAFGFVFAGFFTILAGVSLWRHGSLWPWFLGIAATFAVVALTAPKVLKPLNKLWTAFGLLLHKVVSPLVMIIIFFGVVTPIGLLMRVLKKRPLDLEINASSPTYWKSRATEVQTADAMTRQF